MSVDCMSAESCVSGLNSHHGIATLRAGRVFNLALNIIIDEMPHAAINVPRPEDGFAIAERIAGQLAALASWPGSLGFFKKSPTAPRPPGSGETAGDDVGYVRGGRALGSDSERWRLFQAPAVRIPGMKYKQPSQLAFAFIWLSVFAASLGLCKAFVSRYQIDGPISMILGVVALFGAAASLGCLLKTTFNSIELWVSAAMWLWAALAVFTVIGVVALL